VCLGARLSIVRMLEFEFSSLGLGIFVLFVFCVCFLMSGRVGRRNCLCHSSVNGEQTEIQFVLNFRV
jgi:hypothetical protein